MAGRAFKAAGLMDSAVSAWRRAADCSYKMGNLKQGSQTLESAGRDMSMAKDNAGKVEAARLYAEAAGFLQEASEPVRAADLKLRAAKLVEGFDKDLVRGHAWQRGVARRLLAQGPCAVLPPPP
jgi:hypothetical protein